MHPTRAFGAPKAAAFLHDQLPLQRSRFCMGRRGRVMLTVGRKVEKRVSVTRVKVSERGLAYLPGGG